ncbi:hypothetical protein LQ327_18205 [Actinomycetospora endophytica]|uniref:Type III secretion system (T3SS) SseB-like protein n=1 Tax=Actinomycetospora endophytica TaxID=2291215 RepID=A0ABS8PAZ0_9PSEU|nr:hypothetical protein [Actinomycetospora endophytica]MCD2195304.1 hypothetical protein [Actinomycetospora endophytica]
MSGPNGAALPGLRTPGRLTVPDRAQRDDLAEFVGRAVRLDGAVVVRLRARPGSDGEPDAVQAWAPTPFDALVTRTAPGGVVPDDVTVVGSDLLAALAVSGAESVEPGTPVDDRWRGPLPPVRPDHRWEVVGEVPAAEIDGLAERGVAAARAGDPSGRPSAALLDQVVLTVTGDGSGTEVRVPMRCVFALSGMGFVGSGETGGTVRVATDGGWLRLDTRGGAVVRRRRAQLPWA